MDTEDRNSTLSSTLARLEVDCSVKKIWGRHAGGEPWLRFQMSCSVPESLRQLLEKSDPAQQLDALSDPDARYIAASAFAALNRFHLLRAPERVTYVLELARRNQEPFASTRIGFVFGPEPWWDREQMPAIHHLGTLAAPWERSMTPAIQRYLFPKMKTKQHRPVSTLAVYLCSLMAGSALDDAIIPDLKRVIDSCPDSFEARCADEALEKMDTGDRSSR